MRLVVKTYRRRSAERFCRKHPECSAMVGEMLWASLGLDEVILGSDERIVINRCSRCLYELCGFSPVWGRVMLKEHDCEVCGKRGIVLKFRTSIPYPGVRRLVCIDCFKGIEERVVVGEGGSVDQEERGF